MKLYVFLLLYMKGVENMEDFRILDLYFDRNESAIEETDKKYGRYCRSISYNILSSHEDAGEVVNDTYLKAWNSIPPSRPDPLKSYLGTITRRLSLNRYEHINAQKRGGRTAVALDELSECISEGEDIGESVALSDSLNRFLGGLSRDKRRIFLRRYFYMCTVSEIARDFNMKESAVAMTLSRIRRKLKIFLEKEGFFV